MLHIQQKANLSLTTAAVLSCSKKSKMFLTSVVVKCVFTCASKTTFIPSQSHLSLAPFRKNVTFEVKLLHVWANVIGTHLFSNETSL